MNTLNNVINFDIKQSRGYNTPLRDALFLLKRIRQYRTYSYIEDLSDKNFDIKYHVNFS